MSTKIQTVESFKERYPLKAEMMIIIMSVVIVSGTIRQYESNVVIDYTTFALAFAAFAVVAFAFVVA
jgi:hypothetical protein